jgi:hypothetical protein
MLTCEITISTTCRLFALISSYMLTSLAVTKGLVSGERVGPPLAWHPFKSHDFIVDVGTRFCLPMHKMASFYHVFQWSTDSSVFEDFIEQLLAHCGRWPEPKSVLMMDNSSFHRSERVAQLYSDAGVKPVYLPPYSPDLNPIEEFLAVLKAVIRKRWHEYEENPKQDFKVFLE